MNLEPLGKNIIVEPFEPETRSIGGLIVVTKAKKEFIHARVVAKGPDAPEKLQTGNAVIISKYSYVELSYGDRDYYVVKPDDILTIVRE